jgi:NADH dehydrogenase FAD-containing subunit
MTEPTHLLIAGGGPAALEAALAVQRLAAERVRVTLLSDRADLVHRPLAVAEPFGFGEPQRFSLAALAAERGFALHPGRLRAVDAYGRRALLEDGELDYDALLVALGARAEEALPGAVTFRGPEDVAPLRAALSRLHSGEPLRVAFVAPAVALPRLTGPHLAGLPADGEGFVPVDEHGRVPGVPGVYAAGDVTTRPLKQGGLACQQADVAAGAIAAAAGAPVHPEPYRPVLRALLLTGGRPWYLRHAPGGASLAADDAPWWPPHKIAGRELSPYLEAHPELRLEPTPA